MSASTLTPTTIFPAGAVEQTVRDAVKHLREDADFNRSWTDGRRGDPLTASAAYVARRIEVAEERDRWTVAIEALITMAQHVSTVLALARTRLAAQIELDLKGCCLLNPDLTPNEATIASVDDAERIAGLRADLTDLDAVLLRHMVALIGEAQA